ncbi:MAG: glycosyltransferase family 39 protein [Candidatus Sulfotelmatobacter sp.]
MRAYFTRERFGRPQFLAGFLLLAFLAQAIWLIRAELRDAHEPDAGEAILVSEGWKQWHGRGIAGAPMMEADVGPFEKSEPEFDTERSPLIYLASSAPLLIWPRDLSAESAAYWRWLPRLPFLACGLFLGASLWYVARRLCGNTGGLIALALYSFSPAMIQASAVWHTEPDIAAAWGAFGTIFTTIAVAHTLYAPREVVLWNWRRIVLLAISLAIAVGSQFSMIILVPLALGFLLYVAPVRKQAGVVIWAAACIVTLAPFAGFYFFHLRAFAESMKNAAFWDATWRGFVIPGVYKQVAIELGRACPALALAFPAALVAYIAWRRTRYFGNSAPLLVAVLFIVLGIAHPHVAGAGFLLAAMPFLLIFVSGIAADLLETSYRPLVTACVWALLVTYVARTVYALAQVPGG